MKLYSITRKAVQAAIIGIFHDEAARARVCDREIDVSHFTPSRPSCSEAVGQSKEPAA